MSNNNKTQKINELAKKKSVDRQEQVLKEIKTMMKKGEKISFYSVAKATGASKSYLYNNSTISEAIKAARNEPDIRKRTKESDKVLITALKLENRKLKQQVNSLNENNGESYKIKYENLLEENKKLKEQLEKAYTIW